MCGCFLKKRTLFFIRKHLVIEFPQKKKILQTNFRLQSLELEISDMKECLPFNFLQSQSSFEFQKFGEVAENNPRTVELFPNKYLEIIA